MSFFKKWLAQLTTWMNSRYGMDQLALVTLIVSLLFQIIASAGGESCRK